MGMRIEEVRRLLQYLTFTVLHPPWPGVYWHSVPSGILPLEKYFVVCETRGTMQFLHLRVDTIAYACINVPIIMRTI